MHPTFHINLVRCCQAPTSVNDEDISKVLLGRGVVASKVEHTAANTGRTVASTTFDPIPRNVLLLPFRCIYIIYVGIIQYKKLHLHDIVLYVGTIQKVIDLNKFARTHNIIMDQSKKRTTAQ